MTGESGSDIFYLEIFLNTIRKEEILQLLKNGKMSAGEIGGHFNMTGATMSYHLKILKKADLVWETKVKNFVYYELNTTVVEELLLWLSDLKGGKNDER